MFFKQRKTIFSAIVKGYFNRYKEGQFRGHL